MLLETTQYKIGNEILTKQIIHAKMKKAFPVSFFRFIHELPHTFYFMEKQNRKDKQIISRAIFEKKLFQSGHNGKPILREFVEELPYRDRGGKNCAIVIVIAQDGNGMQKAEITFESKEQLAQFTAPPWLVPVENGR